MWRGWLVGVTGAVAEQRAVVVRQAGVFWRLRRRQIGFVLVFGRGCWIARGGVGLGHRFSCENGAQPLDAEISAGLDQGMKFKLKKRHTFAIGILIGLLAFPVLRRVALAFQARQAGEVINDAISAIGSLKWIDTTLVTGLAAVIAGALSIKAIRNQIEQVERLEVDRMDAKRTAARAVLSVTLSTICDYSATCSKITHDLLPHCRRGRLPDEYKLPEYPELPSSAISVIKEIVEYVEPQHRMVFAELASSMQVQRSRLRNVSKDFAGGFGLKESDLLQYVVDALEVYARATALFDYARFEPKAVPKNIERGGIVGAIHSAGIFSRFEQQIAEKATWHEDFILFKSFT